MVRSHPKFKHHTNEQCNKIPPLLKEVDINKKTENQAKMKKLSMEWKRLCKIKAKRIIALETSTIAPVISSVAPVVETTLVASSTGLCGLVPYPDFDSDSPDEMSLPKHISPLPVISPFL
ncbi:hypothetical protein Tco_0638939, partial [Tanacetum coccineum]